MLLLTEFAMADFITAVTSWFTAAVGWVATVGTTISSSPILLAFCSLPIVGLGVGSNSKHPLISTLEKTLIPFFKA